MIETQKVSISTEELFELLKKHLEKIHGYDVNNIIPKYSNGNIYEVVATMTNKRKDLSTK